MGLHPTRCSQRHSWATVGVGALLVAALAPIISIGPGCTDYGYAQLTVTDLFQQGGVDQYSDVLIVVDNSASMVEEQARLLASFESFTSVLDTTRANFQLGVVTTDASAGVAMESGVLNPDTEDLSNMFLSAIDVGTGGSRTEQGLSQALLAVNPANNPGFMRPGAALHILIVSDEDDQSDESVDFYLHEFQSLAGQDRVVVHAIVGDLPEGCASGVSAASPGPRYIEAVDYTGGLNGSVCADDYGPVLERIGLDVAAWNDHFELNAIPRPETLVVRVDNVLMIQRDQDGWYYSAGTNSIIFTGRAIPRPAMSIEVDYELDLGTDDSGSSGSGSSGSGSSGSGI
ncbi:MAG: VWA domain-containing protein [Oligoflexia bacterium]|nr:VWA domain-containing protein [Oligoflexia bacterium]